MVVNGKEICKVKADNENLNFPTLFILRSISNEFRATESREVSLNGNVYVFSVDYSSIDKFEILHMKKYLMTTNNIKMFSLTTHAFIALLSFNSSLAIKCLSLNDEPSIVRPY